MKRLKKFEEFTYQERDDMVKYKETYLCNIVDYEEEKYNVDIEKVRQKIKKYNFDNFKIIKFPQPEVIPDNGYLQLINELYNLLTIKINLNVKFTYSVVDFFANSIELNNEFDLPIILRGLYIGYKIYKLIVKDNKFLTSDSDCKLNACR